MAEITAALVKELREMTGAGMMECKKALTEAEGDIEKAVDVLRTRGLAAVAKKAGRATNEGTVMALVAEDGKSGALVELNCETDFVGMNEKFKAYAEKIANAKKSNWVSEGISKSEVKTIVELAKISAQIERCRLDMGMTQQKFAEYMGVTQAMVSKWESREYNFTIRTLNEICQKVDIPVVAIGGINQVNILEFMGVAIDGVAIVSSIFVNFSMP